MWCEERKHKHSVPSYKSPPQMSRCCHTGKGPAQPSLQQNYGFPPSLQLLTHQAGIWLLTETILFNITTNGLRIKTTPLKAEQLPWHLYIIAPAILLLYLNLVTFCSVEHLFWGSRGKEKREIVPTEDCSILDQKALPERKNELSIVSLWD